MPKSRRQGKISLTQVRKSGGIEKKKNLVVELQEALDSYKYALVLTFSNVRNSKMKEIRDRFPTSRFFFGKNKVMQKALGTDEASEYKPGLTQVSELLHGEAALFLTNDDKDDVIAYFKSYKEVDYARAGYVPIESIERHPGPIDLPHNLEPFIRNLGMPTRLKKGVIHLEGEFSLCTAGVPLTAEQAKLLKTFEIKLAEFRFKVVALWGDDGTFEQFESASKEDGDGAAEDDEDDEEEDEN